MDGCGREDAGRSGREVSIGAKLVLELNRAHVHPMREANGFRALIKSSSWKCKSIMFSHSTAGTVQHGNDFSTPKHSSVGAGLWATHTWGYRMAPGKKSRGLSVAAAMINS